MHRSIYTHKHLSVAAFVPTSAMQFSIAIGFFLQSVSGRLKRKLRTQKPFDPRDSTRHFLVAFAFSFMACFGAQTLQGRSRQTAEAQNPVSDDTRKTSTMFRSSHSIASGTSCHSSSSLSWFLAVVIVIAITIVITNLRYTEPSTMCTHQQAETK